MSIGSPVSLWSCRVLHPSILSLLSRSSFSIAMFRCVRPASVTCYVLIFNQKYYLATSRELKRLDATTKSPVFASFSETLSGLSTIRAFRQQERFIAENEGRLGRPRTLASLTFLIELHPDRNQECYFPSVSCNRWLAVRLELMGSFLIFSAALLAVVSLVKGGKIDAG